jgi:hypothetical protein
MKIFRSHQKRPALLRGVLAAVGVALVGFGCTSARAAEPVPQAAAQERAQEEVQEALSPELVEATKVAILDTTMDFALSSRFNRALEDWGRFEIVLFPEDADVCMALSTRPDYTQMEVDGNDEEELEVDDDLGRRAYGTERIIDMLYFKVFVQGGDDLWRDEVDVSESEESVQQLIDHLRERLEAAEDAG